MPSFWKAFFIGFVRSVPRLSLLSCATGLRISSWDETFDDGVRNDFGSIHVRNRGCAAFGRKGFQNGCSKTVEFGFGKNLISPSGVSPGIGPLVAVGASFERYDDHVSAGRFDFRQRRRSRAGNHEIRAGIRFGHFGLREKFVTNHVSKGRELLAHSGIEFSEDDLEIDFGQGRNDGENAPEYSARAETSAHDQHLRTKGLDPAFSPVDAWIEQLSGHDAFFVRKIFHRLGKPEKHGF